MWSNDELAKLADTITMVNIHEICTKEELEIIGHNSTRLNNLKSEIRVPKHNRNVRLKFETLNNLFLSQRQSQSSSSGTVTVICTNG